jgi:hypothetical protein
MSEVVRVNVIVEGQTEETFVRELLAPHLAEREVFAIARRVETGRRRGKIHRGGVTKFARAEKDIRLWLKQDKRAVVTTMFDLYALPSDFPGSDRASAMSDPVARVRFLEAELNTTIDDQRFGAYFQLHEFEGLLFSEVEAIDEALQLSTPGSGLHELREIRDAFPTPEHIDDGVETAPSKRLSRLYPRYDKPLFGSLIAERIGLDRIRQECHHFREWVAWLESLAEE